MGKASDMVIRELREELADETRRANVNALNARHAKQDLNSIKHRLTAAEQRNADLLAIMRSVRLNANPKLFSIGQLERIDELLSKPTESGASE